MRAQINEIIGGLQHLHGSGNALQNLFDGKQDIRRGIKYLANAAECILADYDASIMAKFG